MLLLPTHIRLRITNLTIFCLLLLRLLLLLLLLLVLLLLSSCRCWWWYRILVQVIHARPSSALERFRALDLDHLEPFVAVREVLQFSSGRHRFVFVLFECCA